MKTGDTILISHHRARYLLQRNEYGVPGFPGQGILKTHRDELARDYGVAEIGVFGSCVRGEARADSDIDILVEFDRPVGFFKFLELEERLSEWLGAKVDLVTKSSLKPHIGRHIIGEAMML